MLVSDRATLRLCIPFRAGAVAVESIDILSQKVGSKVEMSDEVLVAGAEACPEVEVMSTREDIGGHIDPDTNTCSDADDNDGQQRRSGGPCNTACKWT